MSRARRSRSTTVILCVMALTTAANWPPCSSVARSARSPGPASRHSRRPDPGRWPWPTFVANIVGAFLLGYFTTRLLERLPVSSYRRPLLGTGLCGGLTTFSTMQVETIRMLEHQPLRPGRRLHRRQHRRRTGRGICRHRAGAPGAGAVDDDRGVGRRGAARRRGRGAALSSSTAPSPAGSARSFPFGTLAVNLTGALVLGLLSGAGLGPHVALLAGTALVGSYTTFSTWMLETQRLGEERQVWPAVANIVVSVALGWPPPWLGQWIGVRCERGLPEADRLLR